MGIEVKTVESADKQMWDDYVHAHPQATLYHLYGWKNIIEETYGHKTYYLMALKEQTGQQNSGPSTTVTKQDILYAANTRYHIVGILPLNSKHSFK